MRSRTFLIDGQVDARAIAAEVVRAGGDPKTLEEHGRVVAVTATLDDASTARVSRLPGVSRVLSAPVAWPKVARRGPATRLVEVGAEVGAERVAIGGDRPVIIAGPCAVESAEQLEACARAIAACGGRLLRGGAYKPRTSPYAFAGHGVAGLRLLREIADRHRLAVVTEVLDPRDVDAVAEHADVLQIGARTMSDFALLRAVGAVDKPVLLKRSPSATLDELLHAAEHLATAGARDIVLCERGVRGFDPAARNLVDVAAVPLLRMRTDLPILVDPSHGVGVREAVLPIAAASIAAGADGVMVECHPDPGVARSDGPQALTLDALPRLFAQVDAIAFAVRLAPSAASGAIAAE
ncbi:MAG: 3-deoxy-7-phosphoheptulonate synthase [Deltaproteobacteria bacterium]|nr:3-deoxy-7-phosphoheptulonate synthase [Deltaproteobacteria bacterium]